MNRTEIRARLKGNKNPMDLDPYQLDWLELVVADILRDEADRARFLAERGEA